MSVRASVRVWMAVLLALGLAVGLSGAVPREAVGTHGEEADVDFEAVYGACVAPATEPAGFEDTVGSFAEDAINCLGHYGITQGRTATTFAPADSVLRWQMALFLARAASAAGIVLENPATDQGFTDVGAVSDEARNAINGLAKEGIMTGSGTVFSPNAAVTRGSMAVILDAFLSKARPGPGAFGAGDVDAYSEVTSDSQAVFGDVNTVSLTTYNAIFRIYEVGVTQGIGDHQYGPDRNVTRAQMAAFIMRTLAHTVARPAGVSVQAEKTSVLGSDTVELAVSVRDTAFQAMANTAVDVFRSTEPDEAFQDDGSCDAGKVDRVNGQGRTACQVDTGDERTDDNGDITSLSLQVTDADVTLWAWTGDDNDDFDNDDVTAARLTVEFSKAASQTLVVDTLAEGQTRMPFGETVTVTLQIADEDDVPVADKGKTVTVGHRTRAADGAETSGSSSYTFDADGKIVLEYTQDDSDTNTTGQSASVVLTLSNPPEGLPLQDEDGEAFSAKTYTWSDEASRPANLVVSTRSEFEMASDEGSGAPGAATATLTDQYGDPVRGKKINFFSDTLCEIEAPATECVTPGIGAAGTGVDFEEDDGVRVLTGEARLTRTTGRDGRATINYSYDSEDSVIETIWATYAFQGTEGVRGVADSADGRDPAQDPDDETTLTSDRTYFYWAEDASGAPFTGRILVKDVDNDRVVAAANERLMLVKYDANDQFNNLSGAGVFADFEKDLSANADPAAAHIRVNHYADDAGKVSSFTLYEEWPSLDHPDGPRAGGAARFGQAFAVDNGVMVVGAGYETVDPDTGAGDVDDDADATNDDSDDLSRAGMAYIYPNGMATAAADVIKLTAPVPAANARFGHDVDIRGDTIVVGGNGGDKVHIYERSAGEWPATPTATLTYVNSFGQGVAISADESTIAALAHAVSVSRAVVVTKPGGGWADATLSDTDGSTTFLEDSVTPVRYNAERSIAVSGDGGVVVSGAENWGGDPGSVQGAVNVHVRPDGGWTAGVTADADATLFANGGGKFRQGMGKRVSVSNDGSTILTTGNFHAAVGEPGVMYVFTRPDAGWSALDDDTTSSAVLSASKGRPSDVLGHYTALTSDGSEAAGGRHYRQEGDFRGAVVVFKRPAGGWVSDDSPDDEYLGPAVNARLGWETTFDRETGDLYAGKRDETRPKNPLPGSRLLTIYRITR